MNCQKQHLYKPSSHYRSYWVEAIASLEAATNVTIADSSHEVIAAVYRYDRFTLIPSQ